ncbi:MAG: hypothetical protein ACD_2C00139G0002 [uncultured bacterium (gcode 4)]|uniref:prephenate dehydratase n=1 Tax=uncultured bacterium (gcode 4) TaxID=1234023 RepID=K2GGQ7_9BACT|nr:MAG: hypothetical protein ACD_2C00139G0002 [uncultured bacterium (gcode 4)]
MKVFFQWEKWAYSHIASEIISKELWIWAENIIGLENFSKVWGMIDDNSIWVLPIENSYAGSIHENMYKFLRYDYKVIWELNLDIRHCLMSKWSDMSKIKKVYSHQQALSQCYNFLSEHSMEAVPYFDTATAAKMVSENDDDTMAAIASVEAAKLYGLNILEEWIQDQIGNTTRFFIVATKENKIKLTQKSDKITIIFEAQNIPASLYKCLWAFATNDLNLSKIESLPSLKDPFSYMFWLDLKWKLGDVKVENALKELKFFTKDYFIIWEY